MILSESIICNRDALIAIISSLFSLLRGAARIDRYLHAEILVILRSAEAAVRRLIVIAAEGLTLKPSAPLTPAKREELRQCRLNPTSPVPTRRPMQALRSLIRHQQAFAEMMKQEDSIHFEGRMR